MMHYRLRKFFALFLCVTLSLLLLPTSLVFADDENETLADVSGYYKFLSNNSENKFMQFLFSTLGYANDTSSYFELCNWIYEKHSDLWSSLGYPSYEDFVRTNYSEATGTVNVPAQTVRQFQVIFNSYIQETQGFYVEPATTQGRTWLLNHMKYFSNVTLNLAAIEPVFMDVNNGFLELTLADRGTWSTAGFVLEYHDTVNSPVYFIKNCTVPSIFPDGFGFLMYDSALNPVAMSSVAAGRTFDYGISYRMDGPIRGYFSGRSAYYIFFEDTKIFSNVEALNNYLFGQQSIFIMSGIDEKIQDLTLTVDALNADYQKYNREAYEAIVKAIKENKTTLQVDTLTEKQLRDIVDGIIGDKLDRLNSLIASGNDMNSFQNQLIYQKLEQIYFLLKDWYHGDPVAGELDGNSFNFKGYFDSLFYVDDVNVFLSILDELTLLYQSVVDFDFTVINNNTFNTEFDVDVVINSMQPSVERMSSTFPFCVPWDMYACFASLAAEPSAPCFVVPFPAPGTEVVPEMVIDLSPFATLSALCRSFLVIVFCFGLMKLTLKVMEVF